MDLLNGLWKLAGVPTRPVNGIEDYRPRTDNIASVAYWYQTEPHAHFPVLPDPAARGNR